MSGLFDKIRWKWIKLRFRPIVVINFHELGDFCAGSPDWVPTEFLQSTLLRMQEDGYTFISLEAAHKHLMKDRMRYKKYAVITADDGLKCQLEIMPWLKEHEIPITLFLNVTSVEHTECGLPYKQWYKIKTAEEDKEWAEKIYIDKKDIAKFDAHYVTIGSHGYRHNESVTEMSEDDFRKDVQGCKSKFSQYAVYVPFYAYPYGFRNKITDAVLLENHIVPVRMDGRLNYNDSSMIHRISIEKMYKDEEN